MPHIIIDNQQWQYETIGTGVPCFVVGVASSYLSCLPDALKQQFTFICCDFLWTGRQDIPSALTMDDLIAPYEKLRLALQLEKIFILGHSRPAWLAFAYTQKYSHYVYGCLLLHCPAIWLGNEAERMRLAEAHFRATASKERQEIRRHNHLHLTPQATGEVAFIQRYLADAPFYWADPQFDAAFFWQGSALNLGLFDYYSDKILSDYAYDLPKKYAQIKSKLLIILGRYDFSIPVHFWQQKSCPIAPESITIAENSGHYAFKEEETWAVNLITEWKKITETQS